MIKLRGCNSRISALVMIIVSFTAIVANARAQSFLDQMQAQMENSPSTMDMVSMPSHPSFFKPGLTRIANAIASINSYLVAQFDVINQAESSFSQWWLTNGHQYSSAITNFPFPHGYWAPGIVGDATGVVTGVVVQSTADDLAETQAMSTQVNGPEFNDTVDGQ